MVRDETFVVELVCSYMNSTTYQKFFVHDRVPLSGLSLISSLVELVHSIHKS